MVQVIQGQQMDEDEMMLTSCSSNYFYSRNIVKKPSTNRTPKIRRTHKFELNFGILGFRQ